jgi:ABC-type antimicrobial peptide transport system permease subunit
MRILREWVHRALGTLVPRRRDRDLEEELRLHLELATDDEQRRGHTLEDAVRAARIRAGGVSQAMDVLRDQRGLPSIDALVRDLRFGLRVLTKDRWITLAAVVALAIGIAANNTVFTIVNAILLRDLPFDEPDRIVAIGTRAGNVRTLNAGVSYADFQDWRAASQTFEGLGAMRETTMNVGDERVGPERFVGSYISANAFGLVGQRPMLLDDLLAASDERVGLRVFGTMFAVFAFVALLLATVGLYAVTADAAARRTREIGVRVALGAQAKHIWWLVTRSAAWQLAIGLSIGMVGATGIGQLLRSVLIGTSAMDPVTLFAVAGLLAVVGLSACLLPARRAMRLDPAAVLRYE